MSSEQQQQQQQQDFIPGTMLAQSAFVRLGVENLKQNWGWFLAFGLAEVILGTVAIVVPVIAGVAAVSFFGAFLLIGGVLQCVGSFWTRRWSSFFLDLLLGVLYVIVGAFMLRHPINALAAITLLLAAAYVVGGIFRMIGSATLQFGNWGWMFLSGLVSLALGLFIWFNWPWDSLWVIGIFIGIDLIFSGWTWVMLSLAAKNSKPA